MDITNTIKAIILLGLDGKRALGKYYDNKIIPANFDKQLFRKTKAKDEIIIVDGHLVLHRCVADMHVYVVGNRNDNTLMLDRVLCCLVEVVSTLLNRNPEQEQSVFDNLSQMILALDEICNEGIVLETDPDAILQRVCIKDGVAEQTMAQVLQSATEHIKKNWIRS